jgi:hypothetical protein
MYALEIRGEAVAARQRRYPRGTALRHQPQGPVRQVARWIPTITGPRQQSDVSGDGLGLGGAVS